MLEAPFVIPIARDMPWLFMLDFYHSTFLWLCKTPSQIIQFTFTFTLRIHIRESLGNIQSRKYCREDILCTRSTAVFEPTAYAGLPSTLLVIAVGNVFKRVVDRFETSSLSKQIPRIVPSRLIVFYGLGTIQQFLHSAKGSPSPISFTRYRDRYSFRAARVFKYQPRAICITDISC